MTAFFFIFSLIGRFSFWIMNLAIDLLFALKIGPYK
jgi:hypothetical protein